MDKRSITIALGLTILVVASGRFLMANQQIPFAVPTRAPKASTSDVGPTPNQAIGGSPIAVPGMSMYTDHDFGFTFWYPTVWTIIESPRASAINVADYHKNAENNIVKEIR